MKITFESMIDQYLLNADISNASREAYRRHLRVFKKWIAYTGRNPWTMVRADILAYKSHLIESGLAEKTIGLYLRVVSLLYQFAENNGYYENIATKIRIRDTIRGYRKGHLSADQAKHLLSSIDTSTLIGCRDFAIVNLMLRTALRCIEVERLRCCDIEELGSHGYALLIQRKGRVSRCEHIGVTKKTVDPLYDYLKYRRYPTDFSPLFVTADGRNAPLSAMTIGRIVRKRLIDCGLHSNKITAHSLRHTAAVLAILNKVPIKEVQIMLGHKNPETTELYLRSLDEELRMDNPASKALDNML